MAGALELRDGFSSATKLTAGGPDGQRAIPTNLLLDYLAILIDGRKTVGLNLTANLITPDNGEKYLLELSNETLTSIEGHLAEDPNVTLTIKRKDIESLLIGKETMPSLIQSGKLKLEGDAKIIQTIKSLLVPFKPNFEIIPGTLKKN